MEGHVHNLTCPSDGRRFRCPSLPENDQDSVLFGELFVGANLTAIALALQNDTTLEDGVQHPEFLLISLGVYDDILPNIVPLPNALPLPNAFPLLNAFPLPSAFPLLNAFPLHRNVQLRATLAMTHRQTLKNNGIAALGFQKVGCDAQKIFQHR